MNPTELASSVNSLNLNTKSGGFAKTSSTVDFSTKLKRSMAQGTGLAYQTVAPVASFVPGGAVMSTMLRNSSNALAADGQTSGVPGVSGGVPGVGIGGMGAAAVGGVAGGSLVESMEHLQQNMMSSNIYMLGLQQNFNEMSQRYTAASNMLRAKHDAERNTIQNFK